MAQDAWYATDSMPPPLRVKVRVMWAGRFFEAVRHVHPKRKRVVWATFKDGELEYLPPKGRDRIWGQHPSLWQPVDPAFWEHPLPQPCLLTRPQISCAPLSDVSRETFTHAPLWWRDATQVGYAQPGNITAHEAEGRIMRALNTNWRVQVERPSYQTNADVLARLGQEKLLVELDEPMRHDWRPPFEPLGQDFDDFLVAMAWFVALNPKELWHKNRRPGDYNRAQAVLVYRAMDPPASWDFIATKWGVSSERARQVYKSSLAKIERAANGRPVLRHVRVTDPMIQVRERNKRHATESAQG